MRTKYGLIGAAFLVLVAVLMWWFSGTSSSKDNDGTTAVVKRGPLEIAVLAGGSIDARESQEIRCEVKGQTKILSIVEEGYQVTEQDVADGKVLVTLDSSELEEKLTQQEIQFQSAWANYRDAKGQYDIQVKQNESDITAAKLDAKFKLMDFEKYLGESATNEIIEELDIVLEDVLERAQLESEAALQESANGDEEPAPTNEQPAPQEEPQPPPSEAPVDNTTEGLAANMTLTAEPETRPEIDFATYVSNESALEDGEAKQKLRKLSSDELMAKREEQQAITQFDGTVRLEEKGFVTQTELDRDETARQNAEITLESAKTEKELFVRYEFPKEAEKFLSDYEEALRKLERTYKEAVSKMAQAEAKLRSSEAQYTLQKQRREELRDQLGKCTIKAERVGMVVYAGSNEPWRNQERIEEGATVYERREIITIPDMTQMGVEVKVHESDVKKVKKGQKARVALDAYPDQPLEGEVVKVSLLPDASQRWMNPDMKLYPTTVGIDGIHDWLQPGMSTEVEIIVEELTDVLLVPIQAVFPKGDQRVCYVVRGHGETEARPVKTGEFDDKFIEIREGLTEGERVLLHAPEDNTGETGPSDTQPPPSEPPSDATPASEQATGS